jgi:hypothetical protein
MPSPSPISTCYYTERPCPLCGCPIIRNRRREWCAALDRETGVACGYRADVDDRGIPPSTTADTANGQP